MFLMIETLNVNLLVVNKSECIVIDGNYKATENEKHIKVQWSKKVNF